MPGGHRVHHTTTMSGVSTPYSAYSNNNNNINNNNDDDDNNNNRRS